MSGSKKTKELPVIHPIFQEYKNVTDDDFWEGIFDRASRGKFLKNFSVKEGKMVKFNNGKLDEVTLYEEPYYGSEQVIRFMQKYGYLSDEDRKLRKEEESNITQSKADDLITWSSINGKAKKKKHVILQFCNDYQEKFNLTDEQRDSFFTIINLGFQIGSLTASDIEFSNGKIIAINGIFYDENRKSYFVNTDRKIKIELPEAKKKTTKKSKTCLDMWADKLTKPVEINTRKGMFTPSSIEDFNSKMQSRKNTPSPMKTFSIQNTNNDIQFFT